IHVPGVPGIGALARAEIDNALVRARRIEREVRGPHPISSEVIRSEGDLVLGQPAHAAVRRTEDSTHVGADQDDIRSDRADPPREGIPSSAGTYGGPVDLVSCADPARKKGQRTDERQEQDEQAHSGPDHGASLKYSIRVGRTGEIVRRTPYPKIL